MTSTEQEDYIRKNQNLSLEQLSEKTGLRQRHVRKVLEKINGKTNPAQFFSPDRIKDLRGLRPNEIWAASLLAAFLTILFYMPVLKAGFLNLDDHQYILDNPNIRSMNGAFFHWCFTTFYQGNWIPLAWINLALDYAMGKLNPWVYHLHSLILHTFNTFLVFFLSLKILKTAEQKSQNPDLRSSQWIIGGAFFNAILFGLHPLHVESVAWANEERDLLCGFFYLLSLIAYLEAMTNPILKRRCWIGSFFCLTLALMSKPMAVSLPLVLLLLDLWPLQRMKNGPFSLLIYEKIPFFVMSLLGMILAPLAQMKSQYMEMNNVLPLDHRILNAFHSLIFYLWKMILPIGLHPFYPVDLIHSPYSLSNLGSVLLVVLISGLCFYWRRKRPWLGVAWLFYLFTLGPVLGILQTGSQAAADRFTYLPSLGPFLLVSSGISILVCRYRVALWLGGIALAGILGMVTLRQLSIWNNDVPFFEDIIGSWPGATGNYHTMLGQAYKDQKEPQKALSEFEKALKLEPNKGQNHVDRGAILLNFNRVDEAVEEFQKATLLDPRDPIAHLNLAIAYQSKGMKKEQLAELQKAVEADPQNAIAFRDLGIFFRNQKDYQKAAEAFKSAAEIEPGNLEYTFNMAGAYEFAGKLDDAIAGDLKGLQLDPNNALIYANMGMIYILKKDHEKALEALQRAESFAPPKPGFYQQLGQAFIQAGEREQANLCFQKAQDLATEGN